MSNFNITNNHHIGKVIAGDNQSFNNCGNHLFHHKQNSLACALKLGWSFLCGFIKTKF